MKKKKLVIIVATILLLVFAYNIVHAFVLMPALKMAYLSGVGQKLIAAGLIGTTTWASHHIASNSFANIITDAYRRMTDSQRNELAHHAENNLTQLNSADLTRIGGEVLLSALTMEGSFMPASLPVADTIVSIPSLAIGNSGVGTLPVTNIQINDEVFTRTNIAWLNLQNLAKASGLQISLTTRTSGAGRFIHIADPTLSLYNAAFTYTHFVTATEVSYLFSHIETGRRLFLRFFVLNGLAVTGANNFSVTTAFPNTSIQGRVVSITFNENQFLGDVLTERLSQTNSVGALDIWIRDRINGAFGLSLTTSAVVATMPLYGDANFSYTPPLIRTSTVPLPPVINVVPNTAVALGSTVSIPLVPPVVLEQNPEFATALNTGVVTSALSTSLTTAQGLTGLLSLEGLLSGLASLVSAINRFFDFSIPVNLNPLVIAGGTLTTRFPFSIPFDLAKAFTGMSAMGNQSPEFVIDINDGLLGRVNLVISLEQFHGLIQITRTFLLVMFVVGLILLTPKILRT